jgi:transglutaminase-like putative cysteine protease
LKIRKNDDIAGFNKTAMRILSIILLCALGGTLSAQETSPYVKFGKITVAELKKKAYEIDSNANAIVLSDRGEAAIEGNSKGWFSINFTHHRVVHILNKNGYSEADVEIPLYNDNDAEEKLDNVKAVTYNLEGDKIVETKLEKSSIFKEKRDKNWSVRKFTMPNVKEGCIIEFEYTVSSDFIDNLDPWDFQGESPVLWSEYLLSVPQFFTYAFLSHGYLSFDVADRKDRQNSFNIAETRTAGATERVSFTAGVTDYRWVMKNVPELKEESYTSAVKNHIARMEFQLSSQNYPLTAHDYRNTWGGLVNGLNQSEYFGGSLNNGNGWLSDDVKPLLAGASNEKEKARAIYTFVRDNFTCTDHNSKYLSQSLKNVLKTRKGNVADINLLMVAMLRYAGLKANPVLVSTTRHGYALEMYPMITSFNYVVVEFNADGVQYYLDASYPRLGFAKLMPDCYNGHARVIDEFATPIQLSPDSLKERKVTALFITNDDKGNWTGSMNQTDGYYESYLARNKIKDKGQEDFFKEVEKDFGNDIHIKRSHVDSLSQFDMPISLHYDVELNNSKEDILYINPMFGEAYKKNPFKSAQRYYPVEMPYTVDDTYILTMEVPEGYVVDELPKQIVAKLDDKESAQFEYRITQSGTTISMRVRLKISRTLFLPEEYDNLREFFNLVVNKENEQVVFKKKK